MNTFTTIITAAIATALSTIVTWMVAKKQSRAQIAKIQAEATGKELENYRGMIADMKSQVEFWKAEAQEFQRRFKDAMTAVSAMECEVARMKAELTEAKRKIEKLEKQNNDKA